MARSDLLLKLVQAGRKGDKDLLSKTVEAIIADELGKKHFVLAKQLNEILKETSNGSGNIIRNSADRIDNLVYEKIPDKKFEDLIIDKDILKECNDLIEEHNRADLLRSYNLEPRHRVIFTGPPGNGKTSLAEALAEKLMIPFVIVRYEGIITSFLGETASRLKNLFDYIRSQKCLLFFDEFDTIGKERGDIHETGEIKRVVSSLLLQIDKLPSYTLIVVATNHPELLDRAVWRRFQLKINLPKPGINEICKYINMFTNRSNITFGLSNKYLAQFLIGLSYSEIEEFCISILRSSILSSFDIDVKKLITNKIKQLKNNINAR